MFTQEEITHIKDLYRIIFNEDADNSKECINFVRGFPNGLRIKVEDWIEATSKAIVSHSIVNDTQLTYRFYSAYELDGIITNYIEINGSTT